jgi:hypothetical protein
MRLTRAPERIIMSTRVRRSSLPGLSLIAAVPILLAAPAWADPPAIPEAGSESAAATIGDLDDAGYDVQIQYENGTPEVPLSQCAVTNIDTVGSAGDQPLAYMTVNCPGGGGN